ncbi:hypothetical protein LBMAG42_22230 [Deltaproteobacteria bacterium]|nr:hypothetical protein LBMAG42_22230 [Deltaproteobacteria bacterium]
MAASQSRVGLFATAGLNTVRPRSKVGVCPRRLAVATAKAWAQPPAATARSPKRLNSPTRLRPPANAGDSTRTRPRREPPRHPIGRRSLDPRITRIALRVSVVDPP